MYQSFLWVLILFWVIFYEISTKIYFLAEILAFFSLEECGDEEERLAAKDIFTTIVSLKCLDILAIIYCNYVAFS